MVEYFLFKELLDKVIDQLQPLRLSLFLKGVTLPLALLLP